MEALKMIVPQDQGLKEVNELTVEDESSVIEDLRHYIENSNISQSKLARKLGYSASVLSQVMNGSYNGDMASFCRVAREFLEQQQQKLEAPQKPGFVETNITQEIRMAINFTRINNDLGIIVGEPGIGKSTTLKKYAEETANCIYVEASKATKSPKAFLDEVLDTLGKEESGTMAHKQRALVKLLKDSNKMFVIDEAQHLTPATLETIRHIFYDATDTPVILSGNPIVLDQMGKGAKAEFAQFFSRIGIRRRLVNKKSKKDVRMIVGQSVTNPSDDMINFLYGKCLGAGGYGFMVKNLMMGLAIAYRNNIRLNMECLYAAEQTLEGE